MKKGFTLKNHPIGDDGCWDSEVIYNDDETDSREFAEDLQSDCREFAEGLQSDCRGIAEDSQSDCRGIAEDSQSDCRGIAEDSQSVCKAIADPPQRPLKKPIAPLNAALVQYLANDKKFSKLVYGYFSSVENLAETQKTAPSYLTENLIDLGFKDITNDDITRYYLPAARVSRERNKKIIWRKTSIILAVLLVITFMALPNKTESHMNRVEVSQDGDSALYWNDMVKFINAYNAESVDKIYPFSYPIVYNRINEKQIKDVQRIKRIFDDRIEEIKKSKNN